MKHTCYQELSSFGHFGRKDSLFEKLDKVEEIKDYIKKHPKFPAKLVGMKAQQCDGWRYEIEYV